MAHKSFDDLKAEMADAAAKVAVGSNYAHYKHPESAYRVTGLTILEATDEVAVKYSPVLEPDIEFTRPLASWLGTVAVGGRQLSRFSRVD